LIKPTLEEAQKNVDNKERDLTQLRKVLSTSRQAVETSKSALKTAEGNLMKVQDNKKNVDTKAVADEAAVAEAMSQLEKAQQVLANVKKLGVTEIPKKSANGSTANPKGSAVVSTPGTRKGTTGKQQQEDEEDEDEEEEEQETPVGKRQATQPKRQN